MRPSTAELLERAAAENDIELSANLQYSGRGMMGEAVAGVVASDLGSLLAAAAVVAHDLQDPGELDDFLLDLRGVKSDRLGYGAIYY